MNVVIYTDKDVTGSTYLMAVDLSLVFNNMEGITSEVVTTVSAIGAYKPDLLLNLVPRDIITISKQAGRYFYCGRIVTIFTPAIEIFSDPQMAYMLSSMVKVLTIAHSLSIYQSLINRAKMFSPSVRKSISDNLKYIPYGVLDIYKPKPLSEKNLDKFIAPFTRAVEGYKRFSVHLRLTDLTNVLFTQHGYNLTSSFYKASDTLTKIDPDIKTHEIRDVILDRTEYARNLSNYSFAIATSNYESFGLFYIELLLSGVIIVFTDYPWVHKLLPNYPYVCSDNEVPAMVLGIRQDYERHYNNLVDVIIPEIRANYLLENFATKLLEEVQ